jgi:site-specific DNA recombinase
LKVAIYARYSSDNQREASIADQLRVCRDHATRQGWTVTEEFTDHAVSGATLLRAGFQALIGMLSMGASTSSSPKRWIDSAVIKKTRPASSSD